MMKIVKIVLVALILVGLAVSQFGCKSASDEAEALENQVVTVQRGDLTVDITAVGNLLFSNEEELAFEVSGTVGEVLVEVGDSVEEGQTLVQLDVSEWEEQIEALERSLIAAERQLAVEKSDLLQAEISLKNAKIALEEAQDLWLETLSGGSAVKRAKDYLEYAQWQLSQSTTPAEIEVWTNEVLSAQKNLREAEARLSGVLSEIEEVAIKKLQVELAQMRLEEAQNAVADAEQAIADAQEALDEAKATSPVIEAPFAGIITRVNVSVGDVVRKGSVVVILADPSKFGAAFMVGETDILQVKLGGEAWVQVDAMPGMSLPAKVTHISPTATIQSGVVNYRVKVEIESLEAVQRERQGAMQEVMESITQGELPERIRQAIEEGRITQEQADAMLERIQQGELPMQPGQGGQPGQMATPVPENFQLREGLTVTVSILVEARNDVLLVPNSTITSKEGQAYVQVVSPDGTTEERPVTTGLSDWQYTEVIEGLSEGDKVVITGTTTTTTSTTSERQPQGGIRMPGMGGPR